MRKIPLPEHPPSSDVDADVSRLRRLLTELGRRWSLRDPLGDLGEPSHLTAPQLHAVLWLGCDGALSMRELSRRGGVSEKTMTGVVDRLEEAGLVQRGRDDADRRVVRARLTRKGQALHRAVDERLVAKLRHVLGLLDAKDRRGLCAIFERLVLRLGRAEREGK